MAARNSRYRIDAPLRLASRFWMACFAATVAIPVGAQTVVTVPQSLWDRPRAAAGVLGQPAVRQAIAAWTAREGGIAVRHGPGQDALLQAEELRAWLISLAVEAGRVMLRGDLRAGEPLQLELQSE